MRLLLCHILAGAFVFGQSPKDLQRQKEEAARKAKAAINPIESQTMASLQIDFQNVQSMQSNILVQLSEIRQHLRINGQAVGLDKSQPNVITAPKITEIINALTGVKAELTEQSKAIAEIKKPSLSVASVDPGELAKAVAGEIVKLAPQPANTTELGRAIAAELKKLPVLNGNSITPAQLASLTNSIASTIQANFTNGISPRPSESLLDLIKNPLYLLVAFSYAVILTLLTRLIFGNPRKDSSLELIQRALKPAISGLTDLDQQMQKLKGEVKAQLTEAEGLGKQLKDHNAGLEIAARAAKQLTDSAGRANEMESRLDTAVTNVESSARSLDAAKAALDQDRADLIANREHQISTWSARFTDIETKLGKVDESLQALDRKAHAADSNPSNHDGTTASLTPEAIGKAVQEAVSSMELRKSLDPVFLAKLENIESKVRKFDDNSRSLATTEREKTVPVPGQKLKSSASMPELIRNVIQEELRNQAAVLITRMGELQAEGSRNMASGTTANIAQAAPGDSVIAPPNSGAAPVRIWPRPFLDDEPLEHWRAILEENKANSDVDELLTQLEILQRELEKLSLDENGKPVYDQLAEALGRISECVYKTLTDIAPKGDDPSHKWYVALQGELKQRRIPIVIGVPVPGTPFSPDMERMNPTPDAARTKVERAYSWSVTDTSNGRRMRWAKVTTV